MNKIKFDELKTPEEINALIYEFELDRAEYIKAVALIELEIAKVNAVIEQDISVDKSLKNDQERKARRYELQTADAYTELQSALIDLVFNKNQCEAAITYAKNALKIFLNIAKDENN